MLQSGFTSPTFCSGKYTLDANAHLFAPEFFWASGFTCCTCLIRKKKAFGENVFHAKGMFDFTSFNQQFFFGLKKKKRLDYFFLEILMEHLRVLTSQCCVSMNLRSESSNDTPV
ncbi:hypothetical protein CHARACLAT_017848 [Characodon lateralis]|uniref:Uncharacterized protein n=1 Tax=Characodon lateralis TaxID=208331 RepID=A0ABU7E1Z1_9TELE|nr:hypothetical protein [Characodon lateralis]